MPADYKELGKSVGSLAAFSSNILFYRSEGYFATEAGLLPLLHTWSLAVEEQFYLAFPLLVVLGMKFGAKSFIIGLTTLAGISLVWSVRTVNNDMPAAFYLLPSRFWELALGALVAVIPVLSKESGRWFRETSCVVGLTSIVASMVFYSKETTFPGLAAAPPCIGAAMIIRFGSGRQTLVSSILSTKPLVFVGLISYSLYLWHWPLLVFLKHFYYPSEIHMPILIGAGTSTLILSILSWRFVETPFRKSRVEFRCKTFLAAGATLAFFLFSGSAIFLSRGFVHRFSAKVTKLNYDDKIQGVDYSRYLVKSAETYQQSKCKQIGQVDVEPRVFFWGDSHLESILGTVDEICKAENTSAVVGFRRALPPLLGVFVGRNDPEALIRLNESAVDMIEREGITDVVLVARWSAYCEFGKADQMMWLNGSRTVNEARAMMEQAIISTVDRIRRTGARVWILKDVPQQKCNIPRGLGQYALRGIDPESIEVSLSEHEARESFLSSVFEKMDQLPGVEVLDLAHSLLDKHDQKFIIEDDGLPLFRDDNHLSEAGGNFLRGAISTVLTDMRPVSK